MARIKKSKNPPQTESYRHPTAESLLRPEVGTQAQFRKKKPPVTYRYDSSLDPSMSWDEGHAAREEGEALINQILEAGSLEDAKATASKLKAMSAPFLNWAGKAERSQFQVKLLGVDVFDPITVKSDSRAGDDVPAWFLDTDYNGRVFHVCQAFFPRTGAWEKLKKALRADYTIEVWDHLAGTVSAPFEAGDSHKIAVKVIDDRGNELLVVKDLAEPIAPQGERAWVRGNEGESQGFA